MSVPRAVPRQRGAAAEQGRPTGRAGTPVRALPRQGRRRPGHRLVAVRLVQRYPARERRRERRARGALFPHFEPALLCGGPSRHRGGRAALPAAGLAFRACALAAPAPANALVRCCFHAYADSSYARRLDAERTPADATAQDPDDDADDVDLYDGDENHKVWLGEVDQRERPEPAARAPRPRQITRPASVPPPPPPPDEVRTNTRKNANKKIKKKSSASADDVYATMPAVGARAGAAARGWPPGAPPPPLLLMPHPAATLPHARGPHAARAVRPPPSGMAGRARLHYATVDPRRSAGVGGGTLKPAQSMSGLDAGAADEAGGIYRKKGHLNERAFSYSIRQEHRSRSHGSLANLKFSAPVPAPPPEVDGSCGRDELKKEREIMQLVAGLRLDERAPHAHAHPAKHRHAPR